jgi:hypothetical protein
MECTDNDKLIQQLCRDNVNALKEINAKWQATKKHAAELAARVEQLQRIADAFIENVEEVTELLTASGDAPNIVLLVNALNQIADDVEALPTPAQCLAEHDAEVAAKAVNYVFDYIMTDFDVEPIEHEMTLTPKHFNEYRAQIFSGYIKKLRQAAKGGE